MVLPKKEKNSWESVEEAIAEYEKLGWVHNIGKTVYPWIEYNNMTGRCVEKLYQVKTRVCACGSNVNFVQYNGTDIFSQTCVCRRSGNGGPGGCILISEKAITIEEANSTIAKWGQYRPYGLPYGRGVNKGRGIFEA